MLKKTSTMILFLLVVISSLSVVQARELSIERVQILSINSSINPATEDYIKYEYKKFTGSDLVVIKLNTR